MAGLGGDSQGVEVALAPEELELDPMAMTQKYEEHVREQQAQVEKEDFSDMVAEHAAKQKVPLQPHVLVQLHTHRGFYSEMSVMKCNANDFEATCSASNAILLSKFQFASCSVISSIVTKFVDINKP